MIVVADAVTLSFQKVEKLSWFCKIFYFRNYVFRLLHFQPGTHHLVVDPFHIRY